MDFSLGKNVFVVFHQLVTQIFTIIVRMLF